MADPDEDEPDINCDEELPESLTGEQKLYLQEAAAQSAALFREMAVVMDGVDPETLTVDDFLECRAQIGSLMVAANALAAEIASTFGLGSAQARMMHYLRLHIAEPVSGAALGGVSCIWEWARRKRELKVEHGWQVVWGRNDELGVGPNQYMLTTETRDEAAAERWRRLNRIRRMPGSGQDRVLQLLSEVFPEGVHRDDLNYVALIGSRDRRKRELEESGWRISSHENDPSLPTGYYRLDSLEKGPPRAREYLKLRQQILEESDFTCAQCGARPEEGRRVILHVHHKTFLQHGGNDDRPNLEVLCRQCHAGKHAVAETAVDDELINPAADPFIT